MNLGSLRTIPVAPRLFLAALWGIICSAILAAPLLATFGHLLPAALLYSSFSPVCHQDPGRSFELLGHQLAVCHRCSGIYFGLFLASLFPFELTFVLDSPRRRRLWVACGTVPLLLDVALSLAGFWTNTPASRFATGWIFGAMLASLMGPAVVELINETPWKRTRVDADAPGGLS